MPKTAREVITLLKQHGWRVKGQKGSHVKLVSEGRITIVPDHGGKTLGRGLLKAIEKQTGVKLL